MYKIQTFSFIFNLNEILLDFKPKLQGWPAETKIMGTKSKLSYWVTKSDSEQNIENFPLSNPCIHGS